MPATYVVFDLLYDGYCSILDRPLIERRERLRQLLADLGRPQVVFSEAIVGPGRVLFEEVCRQGLEGVVAKRLSSRYRPGKRTNAWLKARRRIATRRDQKPDTYLAFLQLGMILILARSF